MQDKGMSMGAEKKKRLRILWTAAGAVVGLQANRITQGAVTFTGADSTSPRNWYDAANWSTNKVPSAANSNAVIFDDAGDLNLNGQTVTLGHNDSALTLYLGNTVSGQGLTQSFTIASPQGSNTLTLSPGTSAPYQSGLIADSTVNETISCAVALGASQAWINYGTGTVTFSGPIGDGGSGYGISKQSTGTLVLSGTNTFSGTYIARGGATIVGNDQGLGTATSAIVSFPSSTSSASILASTDTISQNITVQSNTTTQNGATLGSAPSQGASLWTGQITVNQPTNVTGGTAGAATFSGSIVDGTGNSGSINGAADSYSFISSNLTKVDGGTVILSGTNTYSGSTTVQAGTLLVNGANLGNSGVQGAYSVLTGATLGGSGSIATGTLSSGLSLANGGTLSPGTPATPGTFTVSGDATLDGTLSLRVGDAGTDLLSLTGVLTINSDATLNLVVATPLTASAYVLATYSGLAGAGTFSNVNNLPPGYGLNYSYGGDEIALVSNTPEPTTLSLVLLPGTILLRRRRSRAGQ
jgi:fibronectin-binding autotransporter adhesin